MARSNPRIIFLYLLFPAIFIIFIYSFIFAKFSTINQPYSSPNVLNRNFSQDVLKTNKEFAILLNQLSNDDNETWSETLEQRFNSQHPRFPLKVIIVPHSHNDPGWLNTYDQYFYHYTYYVLDNLVKNLNKYPNMTFVWAEMSFFSRWWDRLSSNKMKESLRKLLNESRLEIVTGGWVMNDEATTHYFDMIDQLIEGHQFIRTELKIDTPLRNSFSVDPFGHSTTFSYLLQKSGISNIYIQRTHHAWKKYLSEQQYLNFFWKQPFQNKNDRLPLCHMSPLHLYSFKYACGPDYKVCLEFDFRKIYGENSESTATPLNATNLETKAKKIIKQYSKLGSLFSHNVALVLLGDDFRYNFDIEWQQQYKNYMLLMDYINSNGKKFNDTEITFGTIEDYFTTVNDRLPINQNNYPIVEGDFMPYADVYVDSISSYWTGYFTTRPYFKSLSRELQHLLRSTEIFYSLTRNFLRQRWKTNYLNVLLDREYNIISNARQNLALFQHHDGITGTSKDYVMEDYGRRLSHSINSTMITLAKIVQYLNLDIDSFNDVNNTEQFIFTTSYRSNWRTITKQLVLKVPSDQDGLRLLVLNSHTQLVTESIKIFADDPFIQIIDIENKRKIPFQINPVFINGSKFSSKIFEIEFYDQLYPLSVKNYKILTNEDSLDPKVTIFKHHSGRINHSNDQAFLFETTKNFHLENDYLLVTLNARGYIEKIHFKQKNLTEYFDMSFIAYNSVPKRSGAYLLKFVHQNPYPDLFFSQTPIINLFKGHLSSTIIVNYTDIAYSIKLYNIKSDIGAAIEMKLLIDLEDKANYENQEIVIRLGTHINNNNNNDNYDNRFDEKRKTINKTLYNRTFYVDSNGFQMLERHFIDSIGIEGNYYPMTSAVFIEDEIRRFSILSSHSHGVTSPQNGMIEIMLDRRILYDDKRGLSEGVMDNIPAQSNFWLVFEHVHHNNGPSSSSNGKISPPVLSRLADSLLLYLNYPSITMYSYRSEQEVTKRSTKKYYRNRYLIAPNTLCRYFLLNLRTLPINDNFNHPSQSSLMILHNRVSLQSSIEPSLDDYIPNNICGDYHNNNNYDDHDSPLIISSSGTINNLLPTKSSSITHLFNDVRITSIHKTLLSGMKSSNKMISSISEMNILPFQLESYNVTF
ncbi:alpha-mannosidase 2-like protein [Dermatophagoides farinae]|uniref:Alpha-mannosidase n=1 Tax=Dermatophagoides farinae TaxID=6954 RepID=A0A9D4SI32_DERFA|nr:alpha-mannosidase 2-like protein [Dermatophagoides farinae]